MCICTCPWNKKIVKSVGSPGTGVKSSCEMPNLGAGNKTLVPGNSCKCTAAAWVGVGSILETTLKHQAHPLACLKAPGTSLKPREHEERAVSTRHPSRGGTHEKQAGVAQLPTPVGEGGVQPLGQSMGTGTTNLRRPEVP